MTRNCKSLLGGAALSVLLLTGMGGAASACVGTSFIQTGCFNDYVANVAYPSGQIGTPGNGLGVTTAPVGFIDVEGQAGLFGGYTIPLLTLGQLQSPTLVNFVTFDFKALPGSTPFNVGVIGNLGTSSQTTFSAIFGPTNATTSYQTVTFFSATGVSSGGSLTFAGIGASNPIDAEFGHIVAGGANTPGIVTAPAPLAGAGLFSFLGMAFGGLFRRGRAAFAGLRSRRQVAKLA